MVLDVDQLLQRGCRCDILLVYYFSILRVSSCPILEETIPISYRGGHASQILILVHIPILPILVQLRVEVLAELPL